MGQHRAPMLAHSMLDRALCNHALSRPTACMGRNTQDSLSSSIFLFSAQSHTHIEIHTHLPLPTERTQAFISWTKYPCFLQSPSFLAFGHWDNYLLSFPLPLASGEESCVALVCIKYLSAYCTFSHPVSRLTALTDSCLALMFSPQVAPPLSSCHKNERVKQSMQRVNRGFSVFGGKSWREFWGNNVQNVYVWD